MFKRKLLIGALVVAGLVAATVFDEYQTLRGEQAGKLLLSTIGAPFCAPQYAGPQYKTFFRLAQAQQDSATAPKKTEIGPFSNAVPDAQSIAYADANPALADDLGSMHYPITTSVPMAQQFFDQGLRLAFAFNHLEAVRSFRKARTLDPNCAMCYWGEALVLGPNINAGMDAASAVPAFEAVSKAQALSAKATAKERALIDALGQRYANPAPNDRAPLDKAYADAMQKVAAKFPGDDQIAMQYAEALMDLQPWDYWEAGGAQPKARTGEIMALLENVLQRSPNHPGAIHYYIHLTEASSDPKRAVPHAQRLAALMPGAGHVVHMPFHTYFRVGMYKEAIEANRLGVLADEKYIKRAAPVGIYPDGYYPHNVHSLMVSAQMAGDGATVIDSANKLERVVSDAATRNITWVQPIKAAPYFAHAQFSDAKTIFALADPGTEFPYVKAMWHYARGVGAANSGDLNAAQTELDAIAKLETSGDFANLMAGGVPAKEILKLAQRVINGRIAQTNKDLPAAVKHFAEAVQISDTLSYNEPPYWYYPIRQSLGAAQLLSGDLDGAEQSFKSSLVRAPNNGWALYGLKETFAHRGYDAGTKAAQQLLDQAWLGDPRLLDLARL